jgi:DNA-binding MarR family transcriptional regulator
VFVVEEESVVQPESWLPVEMNLKTGEMRPKLPHRKAPNEPGGANSAPQKAGPLFFRVYKTNWLDLVRNGDITMSQLGLFCALMAFADWGTNRLVHPETKGLLSLSELSKLLSLDRKHLTNTLATLEGKGLVSVQQQASGLDKYILVNAQVAYFGKHMSNVGDHAQAFADSAYQPVVPVTYTEPKLK